MREAHLAALGLSRDHLRVWKAAIKLVLHFEIGCHGLRVRHAGPDRAYAGGSDKASRIYGSTFHPEKYSLQRTPCRTCPPPRAGGCHLSHRRERHVHPYVTFGCRREAHVHFPPSSGPRTPELPVDRAEPPSVIGRLKTQSPSCRSDPSLELRCTHHGASRIR